MPFSPPPTGQTDRAALQLTLLAGGWRLSVRVSGRTRVAALGARAHSPARQRAESARLAGLSIDLKLREAVWAGYVAAFQPLSLMLRSGHLRAGKVTTGKWAVTPAPPRFPLPVARCPGRRDRHG